MLTRIEIDGFKSFTNFSMEFSPLTIIAGLNASGKSNLFDALHLLSLLAEKPLAEAFSEVQRGKGLELFTQYADGRYAEEMVFGVCLLVDGIRETDLDGTQQPVIPQAHLRYSLRLKRQSTGGVTITDERLNASEPNRHGVSQFITTDGARAIQEWAGGAGVDAFSSSVPRTALSFAHSSFRHPYTLTTQLVFRLLNPLRLDPGRLGSPSISTMSTMFASASPLSRLGDNLAEVLYRIRRTDPHLVNRITMRLASLVPGIQQIEPLLNEALGAYEVWATSGNGQRFPLRLLSEGTLRMLALCTLVFDPEQKGILCLEEPENGVHPARLTEIAELLRDLSHNEPAAEGAEPAPLRQVIVNTHSPGLVKACLAAVAEEGKAAGLTVWFSQLVSRTVTEEGKRTSRRVTEMLPVLLPNVPSELSAETVAALDPSQKKFALHQLIRYLEATDPDNLLDQLDLVPPQPSAA